MVEPRDTTDDAIAYDPGSAFARDAAGNIVPVPTGPSVDKEVLTDDDSEVTDLVEEVTEQEEEKEDDDSSGVATG